jgi:hypothetical protein
MKMSHKELEIEGTNSSSPVVAKLLAQINEASKANAKSSAIETVAPQNIFASEGLQVSATAPKTELGRAVASDALTQIAIATSPRSLQQIASIEASNEVVSEASAHSLQDAVKGLDFSWVKEVGGSKTEKTFAELATKSNNGWGMGA